MGIRQSSLQWKTMSPSKVQHRIERRCADYGRGTHARPPGVDCLNYSARLHRAFPGSPAIARTYIITRSTDNVRPACHGNKKWTRLTRAIFSNSSTVVWMLLRCVWRTTRLHASKVRGQAAADMDFKFSAMHLTFTRIIMQIDLSLLATVGTDCHRFHSCSRFSTPEIEFRTICTAVVVVVRSTAATACNVSNAVKREQAQRCRRFCRQRRRWQQQQ